MPDWRIIQFFLSSRRIAVYEVQMESTSRDLRCTCPNNSATRTCRHIKFVRARLKANGGNYPVHVHAASARQFYEVEPDPYAYRKFMLRHAHIEVI